MNASTLAQLQADLQTLKAELQKDPAGENLTVK